jgi:hypothetical protein
MHTIFCCVLKVKNKRHNRSVVAIVTVCLIRNTISRQGGEKNSLLTCLKRFEFAEIVDKIEIYNLARRFYSNLIFQRSFRCRRYC